MQAVTIVEGAIRVGERPDPQPGAGEVLVQVRAAGINNADLLQAAGHYPPPAGVPADLPGMELAGQVVGVGPGVRRFVPGDRVMAIVGGAAQAELAVVHERQAMPVPEVLGWDAAGGFPEVFTTAHDALFTQGAVAPGERVCITGAAGGVGTAAVQLAAAAGAQVVATVRRAELRGEVTRLAGDAGDPAAVVIDPADALDHGPYDVILELVGGPNLGNDLDALSVGGRVVVIGLGAGSRTQVDFGVLMGKRAQLRGSTLRARPLEDKAVAARAVERQVLPLLAMGRVTVPVQASFELGRAAEAYRAFAAGGKLGKIVLTFPDR